VASKLKGLSDHAIVSQRQPKNVAIMIDNKAALEDITEDAKEDVLTLKKLCHLVIVLLMQKKSVEQVLHQKLELVEMKKSQNALSDLKKN